MKKAGSEKKEPAPAPPPRAGKETPGDHSDPESHHKLHLDVKKLGGRCQKYCIIITYAALSILGILISVATIIISGLAAAATKVYDAEQSSRLMGMVVITVTAAVTLSMLIYAVIGAFRNNTKALHATGIVLLIVTVIQALIISVSIHVTAADELSINKSLGDSFKLAKGNNARHVKLWAATQSDLQCCGLVSAEDYRDPNLPYYFPPSVPISCCPAYEPDKPAHSQERQKEMCKVNATYYHQGCQGAVIDVFRETASAIVGIVVLFIVVEILLTIVGIFLTKKQKHDKNNKPHLDDQQQREAPSLQLKS